MKVTFPNGKTIEIAGHPTMSVDWSIDIPKDIILKSGDKIKFTAVVQDPNKYSDPTIEKFISGQTFEVPVTNGQGPSVIYQANVQKLRWQGPAKDMSLSGTVGKNLGIETLRLSLTNLPVAGGISYQTYTPKTGWQTPTSNNKITGTIGQNTSIETVNIRLTGEIANQYDIYYRVYSRKYGWLGFAKNGGNAGSVGRGSSIDGLQVTLLKKGSVVVTKNAFIDQTGKFVS